MLTLIKYELKYGSIGIAIILGISIVLLLYAYVSVGITAINYWCLFLFIYYPVQIISNIFYENRTNQIEHLPVSNIEIAAARIIIYLIIFVIILLIGLTAHLILDIHSARWSNSIGELFMFGGLSLLVVFSLMIFADIYTYLKKKYSKIIYLISILLSSLVILLFLLFQISRTYSRPLNYGTNFNIYLFATDVILIAISIVTFIKRKNFLKF